MLSRFIVDHMDEILADWEEFAATLRPASIGMSRKELRNTANDILSAVAEDMELAQTRDEQHRRSRGEGNPPGSIDPTARVHAGDRLAELFTINQLVAEYRALRASVVRRWRDDVQGANEQLDQITRFDEAIDQSLTEAIRWYDKRNQQHRDLLIGVLGHDLRGPLSTITQTAELLRLQALPDQQRVEVADRLKRSGQRMNKLINDMLDFATLRFGNDLPLKRLPTDLSNVCRTVIDEVRAAHPRGRIEASLQDGLVGYWDSGRIAQVVDNLLINAVKHGDPSSLQVEAHGGPTHATVTVRNSGRAIPPERLRAIFHPFISGDDSSVDPAENGRGAAVRGLGLYICKRIVEEHGGEIEATSTDAEGTAFTMHLPLVEPDAAGTDRKAD